MTCCRLVLIVFVALTSMSWMVSSSWSAETGSALTYTMKSLEGKDVDLADYKGKVVLIVNVASQCGLTPQYEGLQELHEKMAGQGLAILGFPCNQFGQQEPGTAQQIRQFCQKNYGVSFDMFAKVNVNGPDACELYKYLKSVDSQPQGSGNINWNFEKFLIGRDGKIRARYSPRTSPHDSDLVSAIEQALSN